MQGFVKLPREIIESPVFKNQFDFRLLMLIISSATFKDEYEWKNSTLKKGQWLRSFRKLQNDLIYVSDGKEITPSLWQIQQSVRRLTEYGFISILSTQPSTLFQLSETLVRQCFGEVEETVSIQDRVHQNAPTEYKKKNGVIKKNGVKKNDYISSSSYSKFLEEFYKSYGKTPTPIQLKTMIDYLTIDKIEEELLCYAFKHSAKFSAHFSYLTTVINNWITKGIKTVQQVMTEIKKRGEKNEEIDKPYLGMDW